MEPGLSHSTTCVDGRQGSRSLYVWSNRGNEYHPPKADTSGIDLHYTAVAPSRSAGMISLHLSPMVPAHSTIVEEGGCRVQEQRKIQPVAMLGHTHSLGTTVQLWRVRDGMWDVLGSVDGREPQSFYNISGEMSLVQEDWLAGRCRMVSDKDTDTRHGLASYE